MARLTIVLIFLSYHTSAQNTLRESTKWTDTTYTSVNLQAIPFGERIIHYDYGKVASIYLSYDNVQDVCKKWTKMGWGHRYKDLLKTVKSMATKSDTIKVYECSKELDYVTAELLSSGSGQVYDKFHGQSVSLIAHRLERYGSQAHRFYYLPDGRAFFAVCELTAILDPDPIQALQKNYHEYIGLGDRLQEIGK
ncbi:hypothetical protein [Pseudochryseolinea flava]|uniref:Uncharacterized protein n=1 Tax=Pseudochryseolinea flava TaxID=2059302 RepID=A0A364Y0S9_9BACT|nr:hypothetical protein [Pseudochryseolinea flava]RAW00275.1 hypothetical protein DQQ10_14550 [Pseudochryseolinea flava]